MTHPCESCMAQVAILCNHQRSVPKGHTGQMQKMEAKLLEQQTALDDLEDELKAARKGKPFKGGKTRPVDSCAPALPPSQLCSVRFKDPMINKSRCFLGAWVRMRQCLQQVLVYVVLGLVQSLNSTCMASSCLPSPEPSSMASGETQQIYTDTSNAVILHRESCRTCCPLQTPCSGQGTRRSMPPCAEIMHVPALCLPYTRQLLSTSTKDLHILQ